MIILNLFISSFDDMNVVFQVALYLIALGVLVVAFLLLYRREDKKQMMSFLYKLAIYITPLFIVVMLFLVDYRKMAPVLNGISMNDQLEQSFENVLKKPYRTIILGNSRTYRGINPDLIDSSTYNFSFDNETFLEQYFKLKYLERNGHLPRLLILGVDYFEFSFISLAMQGTYSKYFTEDYNSLMSSLSSTEGVEYSKSENIDDWFNTKMSAIFGRGASQYLSYLGRRIIGEPLSAPYLKENGQYIINPVPKANEGDFMVRPSKVESYQKEKFEQIIDFAKTRGIKIILLMPPCRAVELRCYSEEFKNTMDDYFHSFELIDSIYYLNLSELKGYSTVDYMDETHLTPEASDRFSQTLSDTIKQLR